MSSFTNPQTPGIGGLDELTASEEVTLEDLDAVSGAKGTIFVHNGSNWVGLGVGTDGQSLQADSGEATGVKWATGAGSGDVLGPVDNVSTDNAVARWNGTDGDTIQNSSLLVSDAGVVTQGEWQGTPIADAYISSTFLKDLSDDTTPTLGGNLDASSFNITGVATLIAAGVISLNSLIYPSADGTAGQVLQTNGSGTLSFTSSPSINDVVIPVRNTSGLALAVGDAVYITGYNAGTDEVTIDIADANNAAMMPALGIVTNGSISNGASGTVVVLGDSSTFDTSAWSVGDALYISTAGTTGNTLTNSKPDTSDSLIQKIGVVIRSNAVNGRISVAGALRTNDTQILDTAYLFIGDASNHAASVAMSGDATITSAGVLSLTATNTNLTNLANLVEVGTIATGTWEATDVGVAHGGTGASTAADARTNLGLAIGTDVQAFDAFLDDIADLTDPNADRLIGWDDSGGIMDFFIMGTGLNVSGTTLTATRPFNVQVFGPTTDVTTGSSLAVMVIEEEMHGYDLQAIAAAVMTAGSNISVQVRKVTGGVSDTMLSTLLTIDDTELDSKNATTAAVIGTSTVAHADQLHIDVEVVGGGTAPKGLNIRGRFTL